MKFIEAMHLYKCKDGVLKIRQSGKYTWGVPKKLEKENISKGDIVLVTCQNTKAQL
ncbi:hypothetical protein KS664_003219 [Clostridium perfringens]|nr:hypothetical protein [Clostridium perfringens]